MGAPKANSLGRSRYSLISPIGVGMLFLISAIALAAIPLAQAKTFHSPRQVAETCHILEPLPGAAHSPKDQKQAADLCEIDIYRDEFAICPKTWSTSAGGILYGTREAALSQKEYESQKCGRKSGHPDKLGKFKFTMNQSNTSGTFAPSSLLYFQLSRYLKTLVQVPVAVSRSFDPVMFSERVAENAKGMGSMNTAAWNHLRAALENPASYKPSNELFDSKGLLRGVLLNDKGGERYGPELNGVRSAWGDAQNRDFQNTPAFVALRSEKPFAEAITEGVRSASSDGRIRSALGTLPLERVQMGLWMRELSEIAVLDHMLQQQDRVGNTDYEWFWIYVKDGKVEAKKEKRDSFKDLPRSKMRGIAPPLELAAFNPVLVQKTLINDNDAGGRLQYSNFAKRTAMVARLRHFDGAQYLRVQALRKDLLAKGPVYQALETQFTLSTAQLKLLVNNTVEVAATLEATCLAGKLRFTLDFDQIVKNTVTEASVACK
jgi:hypothetical protein